MDKEDIMNMFNLLFQGREMWLYGSNKPKRIYSVYQNNSGIIKFKYQQKVCPFDFEEYSLAEVEFIR